MSSTHTLGNLVRLTPLQPSELPAHPDLPDVPDSSSSSRPQLLTFLRAILEEGVQFSNSFHEPSIFNKSSTKSSAPSTSSVDVLIRNVSPSEVDQIAWEGDSVAVPRKSKAPGGQGEYWVARRSYHEDKKASGTAEWKEFEFGLRDDHTKHEEDFTPTLYDAFHVLDWNAEIKGLEKDIPGFDTITMSIHEMCHTLQAPLKPRCFPILVVTANVRADTTTGSSSATDGFISVTVPVVLSASTTPTSFYSSGRNLTSNASATEPTSNSHKTEKLKKSKPVFGVYTAIERVKKLSSVDSTTEHEGRKGKEGQIEWIMATSSDAKGNVPMALQKMGIPGAIVKDVGLFLSWIRKVNPVS